MNETEFKRYRAELEQLAFVVWDRHEADYIAGKMDEHDFNGLLPPSVTFQRLLDLVAKRRAGIVNDKD